MCEVRSMNDQRNTGDEDGERAPASVRPARGGGAGRGRGRGGGRGRGRGVPRGGASVKVADTSAMDA